MGLVDRAQGAKNFSPTPIDYSRDDLVLASMFIPRVAQAPGSSWGALARLFFASVRSIIFSCITIT